MKLQAKLVSKWPVSQAARKSVIALPWILEGFTRGSQIRLMQLCWCLSEVSEMMTNEPLWTAHKKQPQAERFQSSRVKRSHQSVQERPLWHVTTDGGQVTCRGKNGLTRQFTKPVRMYCSKPMALLIFIRSSFKRFFKFLMCYWTSNVNVSELHLLSQTISPASLWLIRG